MSVGPLLFRSNSTERSYDLYENDCVPFFGLYYTQVHGCFFTCIVMCLIERHIYLYVFLYFCLYLHKFIVSFPQYYMYNHACNKEMLHAMK